MKSRSHEIGTLNCRIALKFDRHIGSNAAAVPVKFQSDRTILNTNLAASRLDEILRKDVFSDIGTGPRISEAPFAVDLQMRNNSLCISNELQLPDLKILYR